LGVLYLKTLASKFYQIIISFCFQLCNSTLSIIGSNLDHISEMASGEKEVVTDEKRKRTAPRTRVGMEFDPKPSLFSSQDNVDDYLIRHHGYLLLMIAVEFYSVKTDEKVEPSVRGVYFHPLVLELGFSLPLIPFIRSMLGYYQVPPTKLAPGAWWMILAFKAL